MATKFSIIASKKDMAGMNIAEQLKKLGQEVKIIEENTIHAENIDKEVDGDFIIFATKHQSKVPNKTLSVHAPGNFKNADYGGQQNKICKASPVFMKLLFNILNDENEKAKTDYKVTLEATHHGPLIDKPCCFIEIGSQEEQWKDEEAGKIIATTIKRAINMMFLKEKVEPIIAIGGPHYCPTFNKVQLNTNFAVGHVAAEYSLPLTEEMLDEFINKTVEPVKKAILDWKGCGKSEQKAETIKVLEEKGIEVLRSDKIDKN